MNKSALTLPKLRFKGFDGEWDRKKIKDILEYEQPSKYIVKSKNYSSNNKLVPVLTAGKTFILGYTDEENVYNGKESIIFDDFTLDLKYINFSYKIKSSAIKILTSLKDNLFFIYNSMITKKLMPNGHSRHYISYVQNLPISIPSLPEQQKIAHFFSLLDKQIQLWERKLELYDPC